MSVGRVPQGTTGLRYSLVPPERVTMAHACGAARETIVI